MSNTEFALFKLKDGSGEIRVTPDGRPHVLDMIEVLGGKKNPADAWSELKKAHPEIVGKTDLFRFPGTRGRKSPVAACKAAAYEILGLLPGAVGASYREKAAELFVAYLDDPAKLAASIVDSLSPEEQKWLEARLWGKRARYSFTGAISRAGGTPACFGDSTNTIYEIRLGAKASILKRNVIKRKSLKVKVQSLQLREHLSIENLVTIEHTERVAGNQLRLAAESGRLNGTPMTDTRDRHILHIVETTARYLHDLSEGNTVVPGL
jgi:hypothetical protein